MAEQNQVDIDVDMSRVVDILKERFASKVAELEKENAMLHVALEKSINDAAEATEVNRQLREKLGESPRPD